MAEVRIVYDLYHSAVMGERTEEVLSDRLERVLHVHAADHPGRLDLVRGDLDLRRRLQWLRAQGYGGSVGLEYRPERPLAEAVRDAIAALGV